MKLYSSFSLTSDNISKDVDRKIWSDRGFDLNYGLKSCMRKMAKLEKLPVKIKEEDKNKFENPISAVIRKSCEITVEVLKTQNQYQSAKFSSGKEWSIEYNSEEERKIIESEKWDEIAEDVECSMRLFFEALGKKTGAPERFSEMCRQKIEVKKQENVTSLPVIKVEEDENKKIEVSVSDS